MDLLFVRINLLVFTVINTEYLKQKSNQYLIKSPSKGDNDHLNHKLYQNCAINIKYLTSSEVTTKSLLTN